MTPDLLTTFSPEVVLLVLDCLDASDLFSLSLVSKQWSALLKDGKGPAWKQAYLTSVDLGIKWKHMRRQEDGEPIDWKVLCWYIGVLRSGSPLILPGIYQRNLRRNWRRGACVVNHVVPSTGWSLNIGAHDRYDDKLIAYPEENLSALYQVDPKMLKIVKSFGNIDAARYEDVCDTNLGPVLFSASDEYKDVWITQEAYRRCRIYVPEAERELEPENDFTGFRYLMRLPGLPESDHLRFRVDNEHSNPTLVSAYWHETSLIISTFKPNGRSEDKIECGLEARVRSTVRRPPR